MTPDPEKTAGLIDTLRKMTSKELAATLVLIVFFVGAAFWVENRYAKLSETQERIERHQIQLVQMQTQILEVINAQSPEVQKQIRERSKEFIDHITAITKNNNLKNQ